MAIIGDDESIKPAHWIKTGLSYSQYVGRIQLRSDSYEQYIASGLLLDGSLFGENLKGLPVFLSCGHLLPVECVNDKSLFSSYEASVVFEGLFDEEIETVQFRIEMLLALSPFDEADYSLFLLEQWPVDAAKIIIAPNLPKVDDRVYLIGYPLGGNLAVSLHGNRIVKSSDKILHYQASTLPGSGGSPVFNKFWELVAIHIGYDSANLRANYGVSFQTILNDAKRHIDGLKISEETKDRIISSRSQNDIMSISKKKEHQEENPSYFSVFISYSHDDSVFANRLYNALQMHGVRAWLDEHQMMPGDDIYERIREGIRYWDKMLLCCSKSSLTSWWVDNEIDEIFQKERELYKKREKKVLALIPLDLDGYLFEKWQSGKSQQVKSRIAVDFRGWQNDDEKFNAQIEFLLKALLASIAIHKHYPKSKL